MFRCCVDSDVSHLSVGLVVHAAAHEAEKEHVLNLEPGLLVVGALVPHREDILVKPDRADDAADLVTHLELLPHDRQQLHSAYHRKQ